MFRCLSILILSLLFHNAVRCQTEIDPQGELERGASLKSLPSEYQSEPSIVHLAIELNGISELNFASNSILGNRKFLFELIQMSEDIDMIKFIPDSILNNDRFFEYLIIHAQSEALIIEAYRKTSHEFKQNSLVPIKLVYHYEYTFLNEVLPNYSCNRRALISIFQHEELKFKILNSKKSKKFDPNFKDDLNYGLKFHFFHEPLCGEQPRPEIREFTICDSLCKNKEFLQEFFKVVECSYFQYANEELKSDKEYIVNLVKEDDCYLEYINPKILSDRITMMRAVALNGRALSYASEELRNDREIVKMAVQENPYAMEYASDHLKNDREILKLAIDSNVAALQFAGTALQTDKEFMNIDNLTKALDNEWSSSFILKLLPNYSCNESALLLFASKKSKDLKFSPRKNICDSLLRDEMFITNFIASLPEDDQNIDGILKELDLALLSSAKLFDVIHLEKQPGNFIYADKSLKNDRDFILKHVKTNPKIIYLAPRRYQEDREIFNAALVQDELVFQLANKTFSNDIDLANFAIAKNGLALKYASKELRNNFKLVKEAVSQNGYALKYASSDLKKNKELVQIACSTNPESILFIDSKLKNDRSFMLELVSKSPFCLFYLSKEFKTDLDFQKLGATIFHLKSPSGVDNKIEKSSIHFIQIDIQSNHTFTKKSIFSKIICYKIDINGRPYMNGANIVSLEDSESRIQLESILKSGDQILIHSAVTKESFYIKNKEYMAIVSPQPLTLTVK
jgi:hypothetical protein